MGTVNKNKTAILLGMGLFACALATGSVHAQYIVQPYAAAYRQPDPLYPYVMQPQSYAVAPQPYPYVGPRIAHVRPKPIRAKQARASIERENDNAPTPKPKNFKRVAASKIDPALIEELRQHAAKNPVTKKEIIVREKPIVVEHQRVVDDPPVVIQREKVIDEYHVKSDRSRGLIRAQDGSPAVVPPAAPAPKTLRVIRAEAEVTILGPDRMSIRLFRKQGEPVNVEEGVGD
ncbi:MAG: hypothetical protein JO205_03055 [Pseudolabrys sp.]|nr:hypothetical protein [Pseudolabrys sp.]